MIGASFRFLITARTEYVVCVVIPFTAINGVAALLFAIMLRGAVVIRTAKKHFGRK